MLLFITLVYASSLGRDLNNAGSIALYIRWTRPFVTVDRLLEDSQGLIPPLQKQFILRKYPHNFVGLPVSEQAEAPIADLHSFYSLYYCE